MSIPAGPKTFSHFSCGLHCLVSLPLLQRWGKRHLCSQMVRGKKQIIVGLELLHLI